MKSSFFLSIAQVVLALAVAVILGSGAVSGPFPGFAFVTILALWIGSVTVTLALLFIVVTNRRLSLPVACLLACVAACAVHVGSGPPVVSAGRGYELYLLVVAMAGVVGSPVQTISVGLLLLSIDTALALGFGLSDGRIQESGYPVDAVFAILLGPGVLALYLAGVGLVATFSTWARLRYHHEQFSSARHRGAGPSRTLVKSSDTGAALPERELLRTQVFTIESPEITVPKSADLGELLSSVVYFVSRNFRAYSALGFIYEPAARTFVLNSFHSRSMAIQPGVQVPLGQGVVGRVGSEKHSFLSGDISLYNVRPLYYAGSERINSVLAVPVVSERGELMGALVVDSRDKNAFTDSDKENLKRFSVFAAALISNVRMRHFQEQAARQFKTLYDASQRFARSLKEDELFSTLSSLMKEMEHVSRVIAVAFDQDTGASRVQSIAGDPAEVPQGLTFGPGNGLYAQAGMSGQMVVIDDYQSLRGRAFRFAENEPFPPMLRSLVIVPIVDEQGRCLGMVSLESGRPGLFRGQIGTILSTLVGNASVVLKRAQLYQQMERLATTDGLTGLFNHRRFQEQMAVEIDRALRYSRPVSVLLMDIDHFKSFNDTYGHPVGDLVLKEIAACIRRSIRKTDIPSRYGGEEFTVIMPETDLAHAHITPERIRQNIENHVIVSDGRPLRVTVSVGWATFPVHARSQQVLIDSADKAMYYSKEHGRNRVSMFSTEMTVTSKK